MGDCLLCLVFLIAEVAHILGYFSNIMHIFGTKFIGPRFARYFSQIHLVALDLTLTQESDVHTLEDFYR
jgi:hypothetical protein